MRAEPASPDRVARLVRAGVLAIALLAACRTPSLDEFEAEPDLASPADLARAPDLAAPTCPRDPSPGAACAQTGRYCFHRDDRSHIACVCEGGAFRCAPELFPAAISRPPCPSSPPLAGDLCERAQRGCAFCLGGDEGVTCDCAPNHEWQCRRSSSCGG